jgi:hypothetical protein
MHPRLTFALKALIAAMLILLVFSQVVVIPSVARGTARLNPDLAYLEVPGIIGAVLFLLCVQTVLVCVWRLMSLVRSDEIFSSRAFVWIDVIIGAMVGAGLIIGISLVILALGRAVNPSITLLGVLGVVVAIALALLVVVMRGLLTKALQLEQDLSEVV